jgi:hypothetical protein
MNDAPNLSPAVLARLKTGWQEEFERWKRRDLSARRYVYIVSGVLTAPSILSVKRRE